MKYLIILILSFHFSLFSYAQTAGQHKAGGAKTPLDPQSIVDRIIYDYKKAKVLAHFLTLSQRQLIPGDDVFIFKKIYKNVEIIKANKLPFLNFENGTFTLKYLNKSSTLKLVDREKFEFEINSQKITLPPWQLPSQRWAKLNDILASTKTSFISFLPVAYAQSMGEATISNIILFTIISRMDSEATHGLDVKSENERVSIVEIAKKVTQFKSSCNITYLMDALKKLSAIQVNSIRCEETKRPGESEVINGSVLFDIPFGDKTYRKFKLNMSRLTVEEESPEFGDKKILYKRSSTGFPVNFIHPSLIEKSSRMVLRDRGLEWSAIGLNNEEMKERAEQFREAVNYLARTNFCVRCGFTIKKAVEEVLTDKDLNLAPEKLMGK